MSGCGDHFLSIYPLGRVSAGLHDGSNVLKYKLFSARL